MAWTKEQQREYMVGYRAEHRDEQRAYCREWYRANRDRQLAYQRQNRERRAAQTKAWKQANRERVAEIQRRRTIRKRNSGSEPYERLGIFERDRWLCGICGEPVDRALSHPHPGAPSIDHIIPLSSGGADSCDNVRLAHFGCNAAGGAACAWASQKAAA